MGIEPGIDALDVERVLAFGEQPEDFSWVEPGQADSALKPVFLAPERPEPEDRERIDYSPIDSGVSAAGWGVGGIRVEGGSG